MSITGQAAQGVASREIGGNAGLYRQGSIGNQVLYDQGLAPQNVLLVVGYEVGHDAPPGSRRVAICPATRPELRRASPIPRQASTGRVRRGCVGTQPENSAADRPT